MILTYCLLTMIIKCEECGKGTNGTVCKNCGLVIDIKPLATENDGYSRRREDATTLYSAGHRVWSHPLSPDIRKTSMAFNPKYQKEYVDYVYVKAYEAIGRVCSQLKLPQNVKYEALNLFKGIRKKDANFFQSYKLGPTYLACIKIACKINDFPIFNNDLASVIDYQSDISSRNVSYMEKKFNRAYRAILKLYKLNIKTPEHPTFINFVCNKLGLPYPVAIDIHGVYTRIKKFFQPHFRVNGYILALFYIYGSKKYSFYLKTLEEMFHTSTKTIINRKNEILNILKNLGGKDDNKEM